MFAELKQNNIDKCGVAENKKKLKGTKQYENHVFICIWVKTGAFNLTYYLSKWTRQHRTKIKYGNNSTTTNNNKNVYLESLEIKSQPSTIHLTQMLVKTTNTSKKRQTLENYYRINVLRNQIKEKSIEK